MKAIPFIFILLAISHLSVAQSPEQLIARVKQAQKELRSVHYRLERHDTLVTGMVRTITGESKLFALPADSIFGFRYWSKRDSIDGETIYDGKAVFNVDHGKKTYDRETSPVMIAASVGHPGGQIVFPDLMRLDTSEARGFELTEDDIYYYLKILLPDIDQYDVRKRSKTFTIDKKSLLPVAYRRHQATLDKVQDLYYRITEIHVNDGAYGYDFSRQRYPDDYTAKTNTGNKKLLALNGKDYPAFNFTSFDGKALSSAEFKGKLVLLDFWEVWCGPCIASMPKVEALQDKYRASGFEVYGIIHEKENLATAKELVKKRKMGIMMGVGNEESMAAYAIRAVPAYVLIDKTGKIVFVSEGYPEMLEEEIKKRL